MTLKLRAWDVEEKEMFKDTFAITEGGQVVVVDQYSIAVSPDYVFVDYLIVMQSTGLVDKNNTEVFDGDILAIETDEGVVYVKVYWSEQTAMFMFESNKYGDTLPLAELVSDTAYPFSVVGNIYETPNLLKFDKEQE